MTMTSTLNRANRTAGLTAVLIVLLVASGCATNPSTGRSQLIVYSADQVSAMGEASKPELIQQYGGEVRSSALREYVETIGQDLARRTESDYPDLQWDFTVLDSDVINAFALPGGKVFVSRGLLERMDSEAQLAGVLGHEVGHVTARHVDERLSHAAILQGVAIGAGVAAGASDNQWAQYVPLLVGAGGQGYMLKFGRDQELEADRQGIKYMTWAGYDPRAMIEVMAILEQAAGGNEQLEFFSTHPHPDTRVEQIQELLAGEYRYTQNNPEYKMYRRRFENEARRHLGAVPSTPPAGSASWCSVCAGHAPQAGVLP